jgi:hypothetical protein
LPTFLAQPQRYISSAAIRENTLHYFSARLFFFTRFAWHIKLLSLHAAVTGGLRQAPGRVD